MNHTIEKSERYALIRLAETDFAGDIPATFETTSRSLFRESYSNLIVDFASIKSIDTAGFSAIKKINRQCSNELGILVLVAKDDDLLEALDKANIADLTIMPSLEEAVDAVFLHELENDFSGGDDEYDGELGDGTDSAI
jgi:anti-anti-sigma regulatory factor